jgi:hypothetical protein
MCFRLPVHPLAEAVSIQAAWQAVRIDDANATPTAKMSSSARNKGRTRMADDSKAPVSVVVDGHKHVVLGEDVDIFGPLADTLVLGRLSLEALHVRNTHVSEHVDRTHACI